MNDTFNHSVAVSNAVSCDWTFDDQFVDNLFSLLSIIAPLRMYFYVRPGRLHTYPSPIDPIFCTNREEWERGREGVSEKFPRIVYWLTVVKLTYGRIVSVTITVWKINLLDLHCENLSELSLSVALKFCFCFKIMTSSSSGAESGWMHRFGNGRIQHNKSTERRTRDFALVATIIK